MIDKNEDFNEAALYQAIGEFVVSFQWIEDKLRQIGWLIIDPKRKEWPYTEFREDSNAQLINKIEALYIDFIRTPRHFGPEKAVKDFQQIAAALYGYRKYRNTLLHSAYIELKAGKEVVRILRSNPKLKKDNLTGNQS